MPDVQPLAERSSTEPEPRLPLHTFSPPIIFPPLDQPHKQTFVFLHGRGSSARNFAPPFLSSPVGGSSTGADSKCLREALPNTRFVFPTAPRSRATIYRRSIINQWYDGSGDWEETVLGHARETVDFVHDLLQEEALLVGGADRIILGGISQGCATALVCLLLWEGKPLGGLMGMCGMLPMNGVLGDTLCASKESHSKEETGSWEMTSHANQEVGDDVFESTSEDGSDPFAHDENQSPATPLIQALNILRGEMDLPLLEMSSEFPFQETPVFLGHGTEDDNVLFQYGQNASRVLRTMGCEVEFRSYEGLGHWYSKDMLDDILTFLDEKVACYSSL
ncbi:acyl-protein thioesterase [Colletotrichum truncatum]|uniref:Acyl-protein thioesterase n=1 Tax=Colletotrichum truncatum TaxID=5467 RepID=A0ACC3YQU1_COLTU|nr:acyl-protein thioesterase [Colletotrichum truncatum]KAF6798982.1 acyl-protein thioesterase [Colletotrichum truncatum]